MRMLRGLTPRLTIIYMGVILSLAALPASGLQATQPSGNQDTEHAKPGVEPPKPGVFS